MLPVADPLTPDPGLPAVEPCARALGPDSLHLSLRVRRRDEREGEAAAACAGQLGVQPVRARDAGHAVQRGVRDAQGVEQALVSVDQLLEEISKMIVDRRRRRKVYCSRSECPKM